MWLALSAWAAAQAPAPAAAPPTPQEIEAAEQAAPTPIEQALMEHVCSVVPAGGAPESDRYLACMRTQLTSLRTDFGRDLARISPADRKGMDTACNEVRTASGREAYLDCIGNQLTMLRAKRRVAVVTAPLTAAADGAADASSEPSPAPAPAPPASSRSTGVLLGVGALLALAAGAGGFVFIRARRASQKCRVCGEAVEESGDLCHKCRHEAAAAVRRAAAERAEQLRAQEEEQKRAREQAEHEEQERVRRAQADEEARVRRLREREQEEARKRELEERRQREEEARERRLAGDVPDEEFDPYEVLDVARGATQDAIRAAYETAREKADPSQVSHLSDEVQEHFRLKSKAVERAFQMLAQ